jgi:hypothetical protein
MAVLTAIEREMLEAFRILNDNGKQLLINLSMATAKYEMYQNKEKQPKAAGKFQKAGNVIYPKWA